MSILVYLAGGMEHAQDGMSWRSTAEKELQKLDIKAWNPYKEEKKLFDFDIPTFIKTHDKVKDYDAFNKVMHKIVTTDLGVISEEADAVLVKYDPSVVKGAGTHAEISLATYLGKPVHAWLDGMDKKDIPMWSIGCFTTISSSLEEAIKKIRIKHEIATRTCA